MKQFNAYDFYNLAATLHPLANLQYGAKLKDVFYDLYVVKLWLAPLKRGEPVPLTVSWPALEKLVMSIEAIVPADRDQIKTLDMESEVESGILYRIKSATSEFETILSAELLSMNTYYVSQQGIYNTSDLVSRAELALGASLDIISEAAKKDFSQAGRCLAFELSTAAAFHSTRAVEAVLRQYHRLAKSIPDTERSPDMSNCIDQLRAAGENPKVMDVLDHIRDLHRNTYAHPEAFATMDEALGLFDISKSAINAMAKRMTELSPSLSLPFPEPAGVPGT